MNQNLTEIICIIDRSGSMSRIKDDAIGGFNTFVEEQQQVEGDAKLTLVLFNHDYNLVFDGAVLANVRLDHKNYVPRGTTALLDAIGRTLDDVGARLEKTPESERPNQVIVAILTDGIENASGDYTRAQIFEMIKHQREKYSWEFIFLAANQDAISAARSLSISTDNAFNFNATGQGTKVAYKRSSEMVANMRRKNQNQR